MPPEAIEGAIPRMGADTPQTLLAATGRRLEEFAALQRIALAPLAESVGIAVGDLTRPEARISLEAFVRLLHLLEIVSGDDCVGLRFAEHFRPGDSGAFGFALLHAPTLREALRIYRQYLPVAADLGHFEILEDSAEVSFRWRYSRHIDYPAQYADFHAALLARMLRRYLGEGFVPKRAELQRRRPRDTRLHRALFGPAVAFEASGANLLQIASSGLDRASGTDDPRLFEMMEAACATALNAMDHSRDLPLQVAERIIMLLPRGEANLAAMARAMAMSERSLQRRLGERGTSFEKLVEQTRRELSDRLLAGSAPLSEISYLCGYSNASAYSRAARGWYGMAPQAMRQRLRGGGT